MNLIQELLQLNEADHERADAYKEHETPDGVVTITVDFQDPEEREAHIHVKGASSGADAEEILNRPEYAKFIGEILQPFNLDIHDGTVADEEAADDGWSIYLDFPSQEDD